jgi:cysteine desulfurase
LRSDRRAMTAPVYMDYNASVPVRTEAGAAAYEALLLAGNPSSVHGFGRVLRGIMEDARDQVAQSIGASAPEIIFTSGATEANNLAILGVARSRVLVSAIEHDSVRAAMPAAEVIPAVPSGVVDLEALGAMLAEGDRSALVSIMLANNETGVLQPVAQAAELAHRHGALLHCDAAQAVGRIGVDVDALSVDLLSLSGHKLGGPAGAGALYVRTGIDLRPTLTGGGQERSRRAGTENLAGIAGFGVAAEMAHREPCEAERLVALRDALEARIRIARPDALIFGSGAPRLPNTCCVALPGVPAETQVIALDLAGIAVSAGAACSSGKLRPSAVLRAMGVPADLAASAIRVSLGWKSGPQDVGRFIAAWSALSTRSLAA